MRLLLPLFLLLFTASEQKPQMLSRQASIQERTRQGGAQGSQHKPPDAVTVGASLAPQTPIGRENEEQPYDAAKDSLYRSYLKATIIGTLVALGGLCILWRQSLHLQSQIRLQERAQRQWVNTSQWKVIATGQELSPGRPIVEVGFTLSNETRAPITLALVTFNSEGHPAHTGDQGFPENTMLLPGNPFRPSLRITLTREDAFDYIHEGLLLKISGVIVYTDALEETWRQSFRIFLVASKSNLNVVTSNYFHTLEKVRKAKIGQSQLSFWSKAIDWYVTQIEAIKDGETKEH